MVPLGVELEVVGPMFRRPSAVYKHYRTQPWRMRLGEVRLFKDDRTLEHPWHPRLDTERLFERGTDPKAFVILGDWDHLAHEIGRRFIPPDG